MPVAQEAYSFVCARSHNDESGDLLPGLCLLTELWLSKVCGLRINWARTKQSNWRLQAFCCMLLPPGKGFSTLLSSASAPNTLVFKVTQHCHHAGRLCHVP